MKRLILAVILSVSLLGIAVAAFQSNRRPMPRPTSSGRATPRPSPGTNAAPALVSSLFELAPMLFLLVAGVVAFAIGMGVGSFGLSDTPGAAALRGLEAALLAVIGGLLARSFIALLLSSGQDPSAAQIAIGWGFFIVPGAVDSVAKLATGDVVTSPEVLLWMGTVVGAFTGMMNGCWQIHDWKGIGWLAFPLDVTWGLAGATTGSLLHIINFAWAGHGDETRYDAHRYNSGMCFKAGFALTQGPVMSNLSDGPGAPLYHHERTHVWQNRAFGPLFSLSYLGWMAVWLIPGIIAAIVTRDAEAIQSWCYYNNPWETWAYLVGAGPRTGRHPLIWGDLVILLLSIPFFGGLISLFVWIALQAW